jgi:outer membrane protein OmpA-like peptidoglycan-associated protein
MLSVRQNRRGIAFVSLFLAFGAMSISACKKKGEGKQEVERARQSLEQIRAQVAQAQKATAGVRARFNALPEDLPGLETVRSKLFAVEEVMGVENARVQWLSGELDAAAASGKQEQIQKVSATISEVVEGSKTYGQPAVDLLHELLPFERTAAQIRALADAGLLFMRTLPSGYELKGANEGIEELLMDVIDGKRKFDKKAWLAFDRLKFSGAGAQLDQEQSGGQVENVAAILKAYPQVKLEIGGFTDNTGPAAANKKLSAERAEAVRAMLVSSDVAADRLAAAGLGPAQPVCAANDTEECKAKNRRIAVRVTAK